MPVWYVKTRDLEEQGMIKTIGIIQEQHPDRARLFMQWKKMDFPIMIDSLNRLGTSAVPLTILIDENGIVRKTRTRFADLEALKPLSSSKLTRADKRPADAPDLENLRRNAETLPTPEPKRRYADALVEWRHNADAFSNAIKIYESILTENPDDAIAHFHAGVAYRMRFDMSEKHDPRDFQNAVIHWTKALDLNPNQYIWRRRIQQYGPRLDKPYPFYDWVATARKELPRRGETPSPLIVEPGGAEIAHPAPSIQSADDDTRFTDPDPDGRINRDQKHLIQIQQILVPSTRKGSMETMRIHLLLTPDAKQKAHWNNESNGVTCWVDTGDEKVEINPPLIQLTNPTDTAVSTEQREIEFELVVPTSRSTDQPISVPGYLLYYVCEDVDGVCYFLRRDFKITIPAKIEDN